MEQIIIDTSSFSEKLYKNSSLKNATIEITNKCPFYCQHCYICNQKEYLLSLNDCQKIIDELYELKCLFILFTGGEILLHPQFKEIYLYAWKKNFIITINTNGYLLNKEWVTFFKNYPPSSIEISIYGVDQDSYYEFTKIKDSFKKVNTNINLLKKNKINTILKWLVMKQNIDNFNKFIEYSNKKKLQYRFDYIIFPSLKGETKKCFMTRLEPSIIVNFLLNNNITKEYFKQKVLDLKKVNNKYVFQCSGGTDNLYIDSMGNIKMCVVYGIENFNIKSLSIKDALIKYEEMKKNIVFTEENKCKDCYKKSICRYCPGRFYLETKDYQKKSDWYCEVADMIIKNIREEILEINVINSYDENILKEMYQIINSNNQEIYNDYIKDNNNYLIWKNNIINNNHLKTIIAIEDKKIIGYLQYLISDNIWTICEIQIDDLHKGDHITFKKLIQTLVNQEGFNDSIILKCNINPINKKSIEVFSNIGFKEYEENKYQINSSLLYEWLNN